MPMTREELVALRDAIDLTLALPNDWVMAGKDQRALLIEPHVSGGRVCTRCCGV
jgi:hypothetical protein